MLSKRDLLKFVRHKPFLPFRIVMAGGKQYLVRHPEMIKVAPEYALYFHGQVLDGDIEDYDMLSLVLMEHVEFADKKKAKVQ